MFTKKYKKGMKDAAGAFSEPNKENAESMRHMADKIEKNTAEQREYSNDILDLISDIVEEKDMGQLYEKIKYTKEQKWKKNPARFRIRIVYNDTKEKEFADNLRKTMGSLGNNSEIKTLKEHKTKSDDLQYTIFIKDLENMVTENSERIYRAFGCEIILLSEFQIVLQYDKNFDMPGGREQFISYYEGTVGQAAAKSEKATKALKKRKGQKEIEIEPKIADAIGEKAEKLMDDSSDRLVPFLFKTLTGLGVFLMTLPIGISEMGVKTLAQNLRDGKFDREFVEEAQKEILLVKINDHIKKQQIKYAE